MSLWWNVFYVPLCIFFTVTEMQFLFCYSWFDGKCLIRHGSEGNLGGAFSLDCILIYHILKPESCCYIRILWYEPTKNIMQCRMYSCKAIEYKFKARNFSCLRVLYCENKRRQVLKLCFNIIPPPPPPSLHPICKTLVLKMGTAVGFICSLSNAS
jgi:hypothetical protein